MEGNDPQNVESPTDNPTKVDTNTETEPTQEQQQDNANKTPTAPPTNNQAATNSGYWAEKRSRIGVLAAILCFFCLLAFAYWFNANERSGAFEQGFGFCAAGLFFIFLSLIATFIILFLNKEIRIIDFVVIIVYIGGAVLYFIGGCVNAGASNSELDDTAFASVYFGEATLITLYACLIAFDYWRSICGPKGRRIFIHFVVLGFGSLILFFGYATLDVDLNSVQCIAAGYFFILLAIILYIVVSICLKNMPVVIAKHSVIEFTIACILIFGGFLACVGYWALADDVTTYNSDWQSYLVGYGFFILLITIYIGIDIKLEDYLPKRKT